MPHLILIHGWAFTKEVFPKEAGIRIDLPCHGDRESEFLSLIDFAKEVGKEIPKGWDIVGWSMGASVSILVALLFPQKVRSLFLLGATSHFGRIWDPKTVKAFKIKVKREGADFFRKRAFPKSFKGKLNVDCALKLLDEFVDLKVDRYLPFIKANVVLLHGLKDPIVPPKEALRLYNLLSGSKLIFSFDGHFPAKDEGDLIRKVLKIRENL